MLDRAIGFAAAGGLDRVAGAGAVDQNAFLSVRFAGLGKGGIDAGIVGDVAFADIPPISAATALPFSSCRSNSATLTPLAASARAVAAPRPEAPPVTTAATVLSSFIFHSSFVIPGLTRDRWPAGAAIWLPAVPDQVRDDVTSSQQSSRWRPRRLRTSSEVHICRRALSARGPALPSVWCPKRRADGPAQSRRR